MHWCNPRVCSTSVGWLLSRKTGAEEGQGFPRAGFGRVSSRGRDGAPGGAAGPGWFITREDRESAGKVTMGRK